MKQISHGKVLRTQRSKNVLTLQNGKGPIIFWISTNWHVLILVVLCWVAYTKTSYKIKRNKHLVCWFLLTLDDGGIEAIDVFCCIFYPTTIFLVVQTAKQAKHAQILLILFALRLYIDEKVNQLLSICIQTVKLRLKSIYLERYRKHLKVLVRF